MSKLKYFIVTTLVMLVLTSPCMVFAAEVGDELDASQYTEKIAEYGVPTAEKVAALAKEAQSFFDAGDYAKAEQALAEWARQANWLANIITAGLEPYYSAKYDDTKSFSYTRLISLVPYESMANDLKNQRNHALVMLAECLVQMNQHDKAVSIYMKVLSLISIKEWELWTRAANGLYAIIGIPALSK